MDSQTKVWALFDKLNTWREESHRDFTNIIDSHKSGIKEGISALVEEVANLQQELSVAKKERNSLIEDVGDLQERLSDITKERNDLLDNVDHLNGRNKQQINRLPEGYNFLFLEDNPNIDQNRTDVEIPDTHTKEQDVGRARNSLEIGDREESIYDGNMADLSFGQQNKDYLCVGNPLKDSDSTFIEFTNEENIENVAENEEIPNGIYQGTKTDACDLKMQSENVQKIEDNIFSCNNGANMSASMKEENDFCGECGFVPTSKGILKRHIETVHENIRKFACTECDFIFLQKAHLKEHIEGVHQKIRNHVCGECGYTSYRKSTIKQHIEGVHENIRKHVCKECGYAATMKSNLKMHLATVHKIADKQYMKKCEQCSYMSGNSGHLKEHIKAKHLKIRNHVCGKCGYAATRKGALTNHMKTIHNM